VYQAPRGWTVRIRSATRSHRRLPPWVRRLIDPGADLAEFASVGAFVQDTPEAPARIADLAFARAEEVLRGAAVAVR